ncbi:GTP cyclohydrolase II-domain-containing protein [Entophlyctis helioformis]|nr:GTP cyclohydrolase II-domain-containing protein [Entophlyctis helioformis]
MPATTPSAAVATATAPASPATAPATATATAPTAAPTAGSTAPTTGTTAAALQPDPPLKAAALSAAWLPSHSHSDDADALSSPSTLPAAHAADANADDNDNANELDAAPRPASPSDGATLPIGIHPDVLLRRQSWFIGHSQSQLELGLDDLDALDGPDADLREAAGNNTQDAVSTPSQDVHAHAHAGLASPASPASLASSPAKAHAHEHASPASSTTAAATFAVAATAAAASTADTRRASLVQPHRRHLPHVQCEAAARIPSSFGGGTHTLHIYSNTDDDKEHMAFVFGSDIVSASLNAERPGDTPETRRIRGAKPELPSVADAAASHAAGHADPPLVRIHSCCFTGETVGSLRCDCAEQLQEAMRIMTAAGRGVVLYLIQEGRGIGLRDKLMAYNLIDMGHDTLSANIALGHPPDARTYTIASAILADLGIDRVRLLTNNPSKVHAIQQDGVAITERIAMMPTSWKLRHSVVGSERLSVTKGGHELTSREGAGAGGDAGHDIQDRDEYLVTKIQKMGHILDIPDSILRGVSASPRL